MPHRWAILSGKAWGIYGVLKAEALGVCVKGKEQETGAGPRRVVPAPQFGQQPLHRDG